jgi:hypothetical protein
VGVALGELGALDESPTVMSRGVTSLSGVGGGDGAT